MPQIKIATDIFEEPPSIEKSPHPLFKKDGLILIEIQGTINRPTELPENFVDGDFIKIEEDKYAVKIGTLKLDLYDAKVGNVGDKKQDLKKVELLIGKNQKLIGEVKKLDKPLGILKFPPGGNTIRDQQYFTDNNIQVIDIVRYKLLFKNRPVPLMDD